MTMRTGKLGSISWKPGFRKCLGKLRAFLLIGVDTVALWFLKIGVGSHSSSRRSVAVFNLHGAGDLLLCLPCLEQVRKRYPATRYCLVLYCQSSAAELATLYAPADQIVVIDRHRLVLSITYRLSILWGVVASHHEVAVQPTYNRMLAVEDALIRATYAEERIGSAGSPDFASPLARRLSDRWYHRLTEPSPTRMHELDRYAEFLQSLGWACPSSRLPRLVIPEGPSDIPADYVLLLPESSSHIKSWPIDQFEALAHQLADLSDETLVFAGTQVANGPRQSFQQWRQNRFVDLSGQTSMAEFLRLLKGAKLIVTNDSAGLHIGVALGRPVVVIAGGGLPERYHPYPRWANVRLTIVEERLPCYGCNWACIYGNRRGQPAYCIAIIRVAHVLAAIRSHLLSAC